MTEERVEKNRRLAEWLGYHVKYVDDPIPSYRYLLLKDDEVMETYISAEDAWRHVPDFYTSEDASALLLEKMPAVELYCHPPEARFDEKGWRCRPDWGLSAGVYNVDRKTATAEAALAYIESLAAQEKE